MALQTSVLISVSTKTTDSPSIEQRVKILNPRSIRRPCRDVARHSSVRRSGHLARQIDQTPAVVQPCDMFLVTGDSSPPDTEHLEELLFEKLCVRPSRKARHARRERRPKPRCFSNSPARPSRPAPKARHGTRRSHHRASRAQRLRKFHGAHFVPCRRLTGEERYNSGIQPRMRMPTLYPHQLPELLANSPEPSWQCLCHRDSSPRHRPSVPSETAWGNMSCASSGTEKPTHPHEATAGMR